MNRTFCILDPTNVCCINEREQRKSYFSFGSVTEPPLANSYNFNNSRPNVCFSRTTSIDQLCEIRALDKSSKDENHGDHVNGLHFRIGCV